MRAAASCDPRRAGARDRYAIALSLPWGTHPYWILLTITVVLRGSFAQTIERRNSRVLGTLVGSFVAAASS